MAEVDFVNHAAWANGNRFVQQMMAERFVCSAATVAWNAPTVTSKMVRHFYFFLLLLAISFIFNEDFFVKFESFGVFFPIEYYETKQADCIYADGGYV